MIILCLKGEYDTLDRDTIARAHMIAEKEDMDVEGGRTGTWFVHKNRFTGILGSVYATEIVRILT